MPCPQTNSCLFRNLRSTAILTVKSTLFMHFKAKAYIHQSGSREGHEHGGSGAKKETKAKGNAAETLVAHKRGRNRGKVH